MGLPPTPPWSGFHVLVVHFPIGLLLVAPVFMLLAMVLGKKMPGMALAAWMVLLLGTIGAWVTMYSGEAAYMATGEMPDAARKVMEQHKDWGEKVPWAFTTTCAMYGLVLLLPVIFKRIKSGPFVVLGTLLTVAVHGWSSLFMANTAHLGGSLVHDYGVRSVTAESATQDAGGGAAEVVPATAPR